MNMPTESTCSSDVSKSGEKTNMTPLQKLKWAILVSTGELISDVAINADTIDEVYDSFSDDDVGDSCLSDVRQQMREGTEETGLPCQSSRHYESKSVATQAPDGSWVGWTYWYGGGKHGEPEAIDWMEDAYDLTVTTEMRPVNTFTKVPA